MSAPPLLTRYFTPAEVAYYSALGRMHEYAYTAHLDGAPDAEEDCSDLG